MILSVKNGCFSYSKNGTDVLQNINFEANSGDIVAILGANGVGKTTLLKCIMGFLKWKNGESVVDGKSIKTISQKQLWDVISYVPQAKQSATSLTVQDMILLGRGGNIGIFDKPSKKDEDIALDVMNQLKISDIAEKQCNEISGGQLQMVLIARAIVSNPKILILDEPESNLDFKNQILVLDTISTLAKSGVCCIFNTHYPNHALRRANKSLLICKNGDSFFGNTSEIVTEKNIETAFGVKTLIGSFETDSSVWHDIIPLEISDKTGSMANNQTADNLAVMSITIKNDDAVDDVNRCIHDYGRYIAGRMGMPYKKYGIKIINLTLDGPIDKLKSLEMRLSAIDGVNVKTIYENT